jgi:hypothetical protein
VKQTRLVSVCCANSVLKACGEGCGTHLSLIVRSKGLRASHTAFALALPPLSIELSCSLFQSGCRRVAQVSAPRSRTRRVASWNSPSRSTLLTLLQWVPSDRCIPEQRLDDPKDQRTEAQPGHPAP